MGTYPDKSLAEVRAERDRARKQLAKGIDPREHRKAEQSAGIERAANSFEVIAREWLVIKAHGWTNSHHSKQQMRLEAHVFPWIGKKPIAAVGVSDLRPLLARMVERSHHEQAHRVMAAMSSVFKYAVATERAERNPAADLGAALPSRRKRSFPTITDPKLVGGLLRAMDGYRGEAVVFLTVHDAGKDLVRGCIPELEIERHLACRRDYHGRIGALQVTSDVEVANEWFSPNLLAMTSAQRRSLI